MYVAFAIAEDTPVMRSSAEVWSFWIAFYRAGLWASIVTDYNCRLPENSSTTKVFVLTFVEIFLSSLIANVLGSALGTITSSSYVEEYDGNFGLFLSQIFGQWEGFGKCILVLCALSLM